MSPPAELSFDEILKFMLAHNGKVTNHELVKHFKIFLMNPDMRDEARNTFKKHVNTLAIIKNQNNEKWLILKKKYMHSTVKENESSENMMPEPTVPENIVESETVSHPPYRPPPPIQLNQDLNIISSIIQDSTPNSLPVSPLPNPPVDIPISESKESLTHSEETPPKIHPRRKSSEKMCAEKRSSIPNLNLEHYTSIPNQAEPELNETLTSSRSESMLVENEQKISVKERKQMFNRMASESDVIKSQKLSFNSSNIDEDDRASLEHKETDPLDSKQKLWILCAARGEYHSLAKMCKENAKLVRTKDPFTGYTAMHWACKRGDENLVKLLAGIHRHIVNERSNGGYTPLHIAMQFRHENVYKLLVEVYNADANVRDWSGKKPRQYLVHMDTSLSPGSYRNTTKNNNIAHHIVPPVVQTIPRNLHLSLKNEKEGFLRIGSLNVRVKKTTEAFSNFLGVGATRSSAYVPKSRDRDLDRRSEDGDQLKSWGSADNIQKDDKLMPPPMSSKVRRRAANGRRNVGTHSRSTPSTPDQPRAQIGVSEEGDSDSDSAAGFHSAWRQQRSSHS